MIESAGRGPDAVRDRRRRFRTVALTLLRAMFSTIALVAIYYILPLDRGSVGVAVATLAVGLLVFVGLVALQLRSIMKATYPVAKAVGAFATSAPLFLLLFSAAYFVIGNISEGNFSEPMSRTDALYFTVTVFATVGFGDITATTEATRALVTGQMVLDLVIVGIGAKIIVDAVKYGRERQSAEASTEQVQD